MAPKLVYLLSTTLLMKAALYKRLGEKNKMHLINFILRFCIGTRSGPFCTLHGAYTNYTNITNTKYINNCEDKDCIIPVTVFLVMLFNACFTYQKEKTSNFIITALDQFDLDTTIDSEMFMITLSKCITMEKNIVILNYLIH